ncbi:insulinase family protein [Actinoplanes sp. NBRC 103695]|uniref:insulinase family protein n=1 Tax=Actinoplanes sp. NBRC 103695 TaxID=3032202 RepID=UPI0024A2A222|nr:insulinase family protein [Actinoplanes sp. NBRC 103695]GLZ01149.1 hypothetical protein Acsp02_84000 [Actinoplanes sp. NBRC 103695]
MTDVAPVGLHRSTAAIVDLPYGHRDDPVGREGLSALVARWIAAGDLPQRLGWRTRHRLEAYASSFSYWTAMGDLDLLPGYLNSRLDPPPESRLAQLRSAQLRLLHKRSGNLYLRMLDAVDEAALGRSGPGALGDEDSIVRITTSDVAGHLARCHATGIALHHAGGTQPARGRRIDERTGGRAWRGGVVAVPMPDETRTRVAVRLPLHDAAPPAGALPLAVETLGTGAEGLLIRRLRRERPLAYGVAAMSWEMAAAPSIGGYALVSPESAAEAVEVLLLSIREAVSQPPSAELAVAATRCRALLLAQVDQPFGAVEEHRTVARGGTSLADVARAVAYRAAHGLDLRLDETAPPAIAITGEVRPDQLARIGSPA